MSVETPIEIVHVEDSPDDAEFVARELRAGGVVASIAVVGEPGALKAAIAARRPRAVLCDYRLPGITIEEALRIAREGVPDIPFICVSGSIGESRAVELLKQGVTDFVLKDRPGRLASSLQRALREESERAERRRVEEELRVSREQFLQAQKMEAIGRLAGGVAHDFNNVLTTISGYAELLISAAPKGSAQVEELSEIVAAAQRAARLTRQLLAFGRRQVLEIRVLDLNETILGLEKMLRRTLGEDLRIETDLAPNLRRVRADAGQIEQVLMNLAINARDAMPTGGVLTLATRPGPAGSVELRVSDTGCGMSDETRARAFEPFFTTKDKTKGSGLGLASVYGIVTQSGGDISIESAPGRGTTFRIRLPGNDEPAERVSASFSLSRPRQPRRGAAVLVVEDEAPLRALIRRILERQGLAVIESSEPADALEIVGGVATIDAVVVDVVMPGMNGPAFVERARKTRPGLRALFISGYADQGLIPEPGTGRTFPFLAKPFSADALVAKLVEVLEAAE